jgi:hypothetical protein
MYYFEPKAVGYKNWTPNALALFRELSLSAIAGTHIQEEKDTKPSLTKLDCPVDDKGDLKFDSAQSGSISCTLTGTNLDKVQKLKLRNAQDATDNKTADAAVSTSGDSKTAKALLPLDQVGPLNAKAYKVYSVTKDGIEDGGNQILHLGLQPFLSEKPDPPEVDLAKLPATVAQKITVTLKGYHLDKLKEVHLSQGNKCDTINAASDVKLATETHEASTATVSLGADDIKGKFSGDFTAKKLELAICLVSTDSLNVLYGSGQSFYGTGNVTAAPAGNQGKGGANKVPVKPPAGKPGAKDPKPNM